MASIWKFLAEIGKIPPEAYDAIFPQGPLELVLAGPQLRVSGLTRAAAPTAEQAAAFPAPEAAVGAALVGGLLHGAIIIEGGRDTEPGRAFLAEIEDWCGTGWPKKWPRPKPKGWNRELMFTGAALYAAHLAAHYDHNPEMQAVLGAASEQLMGQVA